MKESSIQKTENGLEMNKTLSHLKFTEDIPEIASEGLGMTKEYLYGEALKDFTSVLNTIKEYLILQAREMEN